MSNNLQKTLKDPEHGEILIKKIRGSKRLSISISAFRGIKVTVPYSVSWQEAEKFIKSRQDWIQRALTESSKIQSKQLVFQPGVKFSTQERELEWIAMPGLVQTPIKTRISKNKIYIYYNEILENWHSVQTPIHKAIEKALKIEAQIYLLPLLQNYAQKHNFRTRKLSLRASKSRWGSCNSRNDISLNIHLLRLPERLLRYVLLHELSHIQHHNHSKDFWNLLNGLCLVELSHTAKTLDKELKQYSPLLYYT